MPIPASASVRPLRLAENHFLEVLLSKFALYREGKCAHLEVSFDSETPAYVPTGRRCRTAVEHWRVSESVPRIRKSGPPSPTVRQQESFRARHIRYEHHAQTFGQTILV